MEPAGDAPVAAMRASDHDRDAVVQRLQESFADGSLDDEEFDQRTRAALTARLQSELAVLTQDLPASTLPASTLPASTLPASTGPARPVSPVTAGRTPGRFAIAYKNSIRRAGRWQVPEQFRTVVYKGSGFIDLRAAELTSPVTTVFAIAYKSRIDVLVPLGVRVDLEGFGVSKGWSAEEGPRRAACRPDRAGRARTRHRLQGHHRGQHQAARSGPARPRPVRPAIAPQLSRRSLPS